MGIAHPHKMDCMNTQQTQTRIITASLIMLMALLTALDSMAIDMYLPAMPDIASDFQISSGKVQQTLAIFLAGLAIGQGLYGPLLDRYGRRLPLLIGIVIFIIGSILSALAPNVEWMLAARFIQAIGASAGLVTPRAIVSDTCDLKDSARVFSLLMNAMMLGPILAPMLGGFVLGFGEWRVIFYIIAIIGGITLLWAWQQVPETLAIEKRTPLNLKAIAKTYGGQFTNRTFMCYAMASGFAMSGLFLYVGGSSFIFREHFVLSATHFSYLFALNSAGLVIFGAVANRLLVKGLSARGLLMIGMMMHTGFALLLFILTQSMTLSIVPYALLLAGAISALGFVLGNVTALTMHYGGPQAGAVSAVMGVLQYLLPALMGYVVSLFAQSISVLPLAIGICGLMGILFIFASQDKTA